MNNNDRRKFIKKSALAALSSAIGMELVFGKNLYEGYQPIIMQKDPYQLFGKHREMTLLNDRPWNMEAKAHLLNDPITPSDKMFIRNNGIIPRGIEAAEWTLKIEGESTLKKKSYSIDDLKNNFSAFTYQLTLECGGNGRSEFMPPAKGNQWTIGAISCAQWTGVRLGDLLEDVGLKNDAFYVGYYGTDTHLSGDSTKRPISRGIPIQKAMMKETLIAYAMNGKDIPLIHGYPLRLIAGGWPASASGKWINKLVVRNKVHDGPKMGGMSYRVPCETIAPGSEVEEEKMCIIESMPIKSLITNPKSGAMITNSKSLKINGHAWAGELEVAEMEVSIDFGSTWQKCLLKKPVNRLAWQQWTAELEFPKKGYYEVWAKATDQNGTSQPMVIPGWNPKGYLNNACHRIAIKVK